MDTLELTNLTELFYVIACDPDLAYIHQGPTSDNVTILAADGSRIFTKTSGVVQMFGVTVSGAGGSNVNRGGIVLSGNATKGK